MTNREALLEAAMASLQERGYADATARDIATRAEVSLGAIGYHYGSMQRLLDAALVEGVGRWFRPFIDQLSGPVGDGPRPDSALESLLGTLDANRPLAVTYFEALLRADRSSELRATLATEFDALRRALTGRIERLVGAEPPSRRPEPEVAASLLMAAFDGLIIQWLLDPEQLPSGEQIAETLHRAANVVAANLAPGAPT